MVQSTQAVAVFAVAAAKAAGLQLLLLQHRSGYLGFLRFQH